MLTRSGLFIDKQTGVKHPVTFTIETPIAHDNGEKYSCVCEIVGIAVTRTEIWGLDSLQGVELGMQYLQAEFDAISARGEFQYPNGTMMKSLINLK